MVQKTQESATATTVIRIVLPALVLTMPALAMPSLISSENQNQDAKLFEMSIEELMNIEVVSASRQARKTGQTSAAVSVITAEDIHYSGLTTIADILHFTPGVDVRRFDRSRYAVGVRGLQARVSDRTLVLINGRFANDTLLGAPDWSTLPVLVEDIDRIEILRGPGGAAWGANATTGVINIITKNPDDILGFFTKSTVNHFGDTYTHLRMAEKHGKWTWRASAGYEDFEDSDDAGAGRYASGIPALNPLIGFNGYSATDFMRNWRFDTEAIYRYSDRTKLSLGGAHSNFKSGSTEFVGYKPAAEDRASLTRAFARMDHTFSDNTSAYIQWYGNFLVRHLPNNIDKYTTNEHHIDGQFNFKLGDRHDVALGGNLTWLRVDTTNGGNANESMFAGDPFSERWGGIFLIDRYDLTERLALEAQIRGDFHSENDEDWSARVSAIYAVDDAKDHTLRLSYARAFRIPTIALRTSTKTSVSGLFNVLPITKSLRNEHLSSLELGYTGHFSKHVTFTANSYYQRIENIIGVRNVTVGPVTNSTFDNVGGATAYGAECELAMQNEKGKLSVWYANNNLQTDTFGEGMRAVWPARHKAGLTGRLFMENDWTFNANYVYNDITRGYGATPLDAHPFNRLDLTLTKKIDKGKGEFMVGVSDVLNKTNDVALDIGDFTGHETPGRTFFASILWKF
ncbi:MAG: TonB-dependent receptor plug domain-containing protein [Sedimentisphaerales bacterium]|nr:TonB-dependent receptor plug domain-containing protein [Sedimentisphaerales bacterium]